MKEILLLTARYNKEANFKMIECFARANEADLKKDSGLYYKSILGTFEHCLGGDIGMFGGVYRKYCTNPDAFKDHILTLGNWHGLKPEATKSLETLFTLRKKMDDMIIEMIANMENLTKLEILEFPGVKYEKPRYQIVLGLLIHSTHHRGQIAAALDILNIDNDFGGMLGIS